MCRITISTPPETIAKVMQEEHNKAILWYTKKQGGSEKEKQKDLELNWKCFKEKTPIVSDIVEYNPPSGNTWLVFKVFHYNEQSQTCFTDRVLACYYETEASVGCFTPVEGDILFLSAHFFYRYHERTGLALEGKQTLVNFFKNNPHCSSHEYDDEFGQRRVNIRIEGGIGRGYVIGNSPSVYEIRTFITDKMLTNNQLKETKKVRDDFDNILERQDVSVPDSDIVIGDKRFCVGMSEEEFNDISTQFVALNTLLKDVLPEDYYQKVNDDNDLRFFAKTAKIIKETIESNKNTKEKITYISKQVCILLLYYKIELNFDESNKLFTTIKETDYFNLNHNQDKMTKDIQTQLTNILKKYGVKKKFEDCASPMSTNYNRYLDDVESIYAISRITPFINNPNDKEKMENANREWLHLIINKGFSPALKPYIDKYGKDIVSKAIDRLLDSDGWDCPKGNSQLKTKTATLYDGLKKIDDVVTYFRLETPEIFEEKKDETPVETLVEPVESHPEEDSSSAVNALSDARTALKYLVSSFEEAQGYLSMLDDYVKKDDISEQLYNENVALEKKNEELVGQVKELIAYKKETEKRIKKLQEDFYKVGKERNDFEVRVKQLTEDRDKIQSDLDTLRKAAREELPKAKIIPMSVLTKIYCIGPNIVNAIAPTLKRYGVVIDEHK